MVEKLLMTKIYQLGLEIENPSGVIHNNTKVNANQLSQWMLLLTELENCDNPELQKIGSIKDRLHPELTLSQFSHFLIPIERYLKRHQTDAEIFAIRSQDIAENAKSKKTELTPLIFVLENIRSAFNVGSIFRLADGVGASEVLLVGYTPTPEQDIVAKSALGAEKIIHWQSFKNLSSAIEYLKSKNYWIVALETCDNSTNLYNKKWDNQPTAILVGNERFGIEAVDLKLCDEVLEIPMHGNKNSLNVSNSLAVVAYDFRIYSHRGI